MFLSSATSISALRLIWNDISPNLRHQRNTLIFELIYQLVDGHDSSQAANVGETQTSFEIDGVSLSLYWVVMPAQSWRVTVRLRVSAATVVAVGQGDVVEVLDAVEAFECIGGQGGFFQ